MKKKAPLELAYAITVHKAQGSEFGKVFLVLPDSCPSISRELLYTALTRQKQKLIILHQGDNLDLKQYSLPEKSETARRFTFLFAPPAPVLIKERLHDGRFIHTTRSGLAVESKSEVIIANELDYSRVRFLYGQRKTQFGETRYPDFIVQDEATGKTYYWEHCGTLGLPQYDRRWERKQQWYARQGITIWDPESNPDGALIATKDGPAGDIDSSAVRKIVQQLFT